MTRGSMMLMSMWWSSLLVTTAVAMEEVHLASSHQVSKGLAQRLLTETNVFVQDRQAKHWQRHLQGNSDKKDDSDEITCDSALAQCLGAVECLNCFSELKQNEVDWASVSSGLSCEAALKPMYDAGHCTALRSQTAAQSAFCVTYEACIKSQEVPKPDKKESNGNNSTNMDCSKLESCDFPGVHKQFLGDGICNDKLPGCYNTAICGYDMGDCCEDTCKGMADAADEYCGLEGYTCKDPQSAKCSSVLNPECASENNNDDDNDEDDVPVCQSDVEELYNLNMFDSFGDGWEETMLEIKESTSGTSIYKGSLVSGAMGSDYVCLKSMCYNVIASGGIWGKEVSWEVKPYGKAGAPAIASGGAPMTCDFAVAGTSCETTCNGRTDEDPTKDDDYKAFKEMIQCIENKCPIQLAACTSDEACNKCYEAEDLTPQYCFGMDTFNDLVDCSLCGCTDESKMDFCMDRDNEEERDANSPCSPSQTLAGGTAIIEFSQCTKFDEIAMLMVEFDQNNFGDLDTFEACAKDYRDTPNHGGRTAMSCLRILVNAIDGATQVTKMDPLLTEAISALAGFLYHNGEGFCDCAVKANEECPICPSFHNFKTLLYESVNACESLDIIDCDAWSEFYNPCKNALTSKYTNIDFSKQEQCQFVHDGCGAEVPFPSFRRMDCTVHKEVTQEAWSFYENYAKSCLKNDNGPTPTPPTPTPPVPSPTTPAPVPFSPTDGGSTPGRKPYVPPEDRDGKNGKPTPSNNDVPDNGDNGTPDDGSSNSTDTNDVSPGASQPKKKSHFFRNLFWLLVLGGGGYWYYKTWGTSLEGVAIFCGMVVRFGNSVVARVRGSRIPFVGGGGGPSGGGYGYASASGNDDAMYSGLAMESSTSFEPASLPPPPSAVGQDTNYYI